MICWLCEREITNPEKFWVVRDIEDLLMPLLICEKCVPKYNRIVDHKMVPVKGDG